MFEKLLKAIDEIEVSVGLGAAYKDPYKEYQRRTRSSWKMPSLRNVLSAPLRRYREVRARRKL